MTGKIDHLYLKFQTKKLLPNREQLLLYSDKSGNEKADQEDQLFRVI
jgi:hypothetical protein